MYNFETGCFLDNRENKELEKKTVEVVTLGECMGLVYPTDPVEIVHADTLKFDMAGAESNLSIALARLGHSVRFISRVGNDPFGSFILKTLKNEEVCLDSLKTDPIAPTGLFFREWLEDGQRRVYYYRKGSAASFLSELDIQKEMLIGSRLVHITGITPALSETCKAACFRMVKLARNMGIKVSFDPNYRAPLWDFTTAQETLLTLAALADFILLGQEDAKAMYGEMDDENILHAAAGDGAKIVILKRAEHGTLSLFNGKILESKPYPVSKVLDPVGAGDGFDAGFIAGWLRGWDISKAIDLGAKIGALAVTTMGDYHGYPRDI